jgi:SagB-type dehydrogenase family enzyme
MQQHATGYGGFLLLVIVFVTFGQTIAEDINTVALPHPTLRGERSLEQLLQSRRSVREYLDASLALNQVGQLLWAAQGISHASGLRTAPSAGALYPLELYLVTGKVDGLAPGVYHYQPRPHRLTMMHDEDLRGMLADAALGQSSVSDSAAVLVIAAVYERTTRKYGKRGIRYVHMEVGHAAQNVFLQAETLGLATVVVGAFDDDSVSDILRLPPDVKPLMLMPLGHK